MSEHNETEKRHNLEEKAKTDFLTSEAAYQLAEFTKTAPQFESITPRWLTRLETFRKRYFAFKQSEGKRVSFGSSE